MKFQISVSDEKQSLVEKLKKCTETDLSVVYIVNIMMLRELIRVPGYSRKSTIL